MFEPDEIPHLQDLPFGSYLYWFWFLKLCKWEQFRLLHKFMSTSWHIYSFVDIESWKIYLKTFLPKSHHYFDCTIVLSLGINYLGNLSIRKLDPLSIRSFSPLQNLPVPFDPYLFAFIGEMLRLFELVRMKFLSLFDHEWNGFTSNSCLPFLI